QFVQKGEVFVAQSISPQQKIESKPHDSPPLVKCILLPEGCPYQGQAARRETNAAKAVTLFCQVHA
ncbi:MAG TPA: hypothetical protein PKI05_05590, partial [Thermogutta sp.]|nr:hypothetical protein [Thermogutta sp.]